MEQAKLTSKDTENSAKNFFISAIRCLPLKYKDENEYEDEFYCPRNNNILDDASGSKNFQFPSVKFGKLSPLSQQKKMVASITFLLQKH
ncbi:15913_t:CDS:2 [Cetraspora pellucida]|uniref:15913_t:CDS:1 n=1 Tax=Cetraspora pellucida TaxID=1433469 RepID=A0A9N8ZJW9_9GLOM|nr:15913_t:CDS:2 [Cetraspora pellucida]